MRSRWLLTLLLLITGLSDLQANPGDLYSGLSGEVYKFTPLGAETLFVSESADALAFDSAGNLFVTDGWRSKIKKVTPGGVATDFATVGSNPTGLACDASGNLFVGEASTDSIIKVTPTGASSTFASGVIGPFGLAFDRNGNLFVSEQGMGGMGTISKITPGGTRTTFASGLSAPEGLAFDSGGNLYEVDFNSGMVLKFTPGGVKSTFAMGLFAPHDIAIDQNDNVFVTDIATQEILKFTPNGTKTTFASITIAAGGGLAFEPATGQSPAARVTNISTRASVLTGQGVTVAGFIITGTDSKTVLLRGLGPTLGQPPFNVTAVLADPTLQLFDGGGHPLWFNDNWKDTQQAQIQSTGKAPPNDLESAILQVLQPGNYTAVFSGKNETTGVGLVEVYDVSQGVHAEIANVSTRGFVGTDQSVMIGGFITSGGNGSTEVVIRGLGPTLVQFGVANALADPLVTLVDSMGNVVAANNNWKDTQQAAIHTTGLAPPNDLEAAIVITLSNGNYTALVGGFNGATGVGLVEIYKR